MQLPTTACPAGTVSPSVRRDPAAHRSPPGRRHFLLESPIGPLLIAVAAASLAAWVARKHHGEQLENDRGMRDLDHAGRSIGAAVETIQERIHALTTLDTEAVFATEATRRLKAAEAVNDESPWLTRGADNLPYDTRDVPELEAATQSYLREKAKTSKPGPPIRAETEANDRVAEQRTTVEASSASYSPTRRACGLPSVKRPNPRPPPGASRGTPGLGREPAARHEHGRVRRQRGHGGARGLVEPATPTFHGGMPTLVRTARGRPASAASRMEVASARPRPIGMGHLPHSRLPKRYRCPMAASIDFTISFEAPDEDGWIVARVLEVPGAISQGRTREEARENALDALRTVLTPDEELAGETPEADREHLRFTAAA